MITSLLLWSAPFAMASERLEAKVIPIYQRIDLDVDPARPEFGGKVQVTLEVPQNVRLDGFRMHSEGLVVHEATVLRQNGRSRALAANVTSISDTQIEITPRKRMRPGRYLVELTFAGTLHDQAYGLYRFEHDGDWYVASQLEADEARTSWPSFDEPEYKIPWHISVRTPENLQAISNGAIASASVEDGYRTVQFAWTPPMPSYAVALAVGPYVGTEVPGMDVSSVVWTTKGRESLADSMVRELPGVTRWLEDWFGTKYPYGKLDVVAVPKFTFGAMENPGCIVVHEGLLYDDATATPGARRNVIRVGAHEVAHMWFGDLVTMAWWDDLWLNEAFATWMGHNTLHALAPEYREDVRRVARLARMVTNDGSTTSRPLRTEVDPAAVFETSNFAVYPKGEALLDMTRAWMGPDAFRLALGTYLERHAWGNATHEDLFAALEEVSDKPIGRMMSGFLDRPGAPSIRVFRGDDGTWRVSQRRFALLGEDLSASPWLVPMQLRVGMSDGSVETVPFELSGTSATLPIPPEARWVHPAADGIGYYAWTLDDAGSQALLGALAQLEPSERRSIVEMWGLQVAAGELELDQLFGRLGAFAQEKDPAVLQAVVAAVERVRVVRLLEDPAVDRRMNRWIRAQLRPHLERIGMEWSATADPSEARLRMQLLGALGNAKDRAVLAYGRALGRRVLEDREDGEEVDFRLAQWGLSVWAQRGERGVQALLMEQAAATSDLRWGRTLWYAAGLVPGDEARDRAFARAADAALAPPAARSLMDGVRAARPEEAERDLYLEWVMRNYERLVSQVSPVRRMQYARAGQGCSMARFEKSKAFFSDPARSVPGTERMLAETERGVQRCLQRKKRHGARVRAFLDDWKGGP